MEMAFSGLVWLAAGRGVGEDDWTRHFISLGARPIINHGSCHIPFVAPLEGTRKTMIHGDGNKDLDEIRSIKMLQEAAKTTDGKSLFKDAIGVAEQAARVKLGVDKLKGRAEEMIEDAVTDVKRMAKKGRYAAEDMIDDTAYRIKKDPFRSVGVTFAAGLGLGIFAGWLMARWIGNSKE